MTQDSSRPRASGPSQILSSDAYCIPSWRGYLHLNSLNTKHKPAIRSDSAGRRRRSSLVLCYHDSKQSCKSCKTVSTMNKHSLLDFHGFALPCPALAPLSKMQYDSSSPAQSLPALVDYLPNRTYRLKPKHILDTSKTQKLQSIHNSSQQQQSRLTSF